MSADPWIMYKKGLEYLKKNGTNLIIQLPPGGKQKYISCSPGVAMENLEKERLPRPIVVATSIGTKLTITTKFMDRFKLITQMDLHRVIRNSSIILTNFTGPIEEDNLKIHQQRLINFIKKDLNIGQQEFMLSLMMQNEILEGKKDDITPEEYRDAVSIFGFNYKLW